MWQVQWRGGPAATLYDTIRAMEGSVWYWGEWYSPPTLADKLYRERRNAATGGSAVAGDRIENEGRLDLRVGPPEKVGERTCLECTEPPKSGADALCTAHRDEADSPEGRERYLAHRDHHGCLGTPHRDW